jgi:hypothetical protein
LQGPAHPGGVFGHGVGSLGRCSLWASAPDALLR